jgi:AcrR family transcriptional regulator
LATPADPPPMRLRELKKARTRTSIQTEALRLFRERGYDNTTVEQICQAAEVSESTFYRYFPTKPDVVLWDEFDPLVVAAFESQPPELSSLAALRAAFRTVFAAMTPRQRSEQQQRTRLILDVPELRAAVMDQFTQAVELVADIVAGRTGRARTDLEVLAFAGAITGVSISVLSVVAEKPDADVGGLLDEALALLEHGLSL